MKLKDWLRKVAEQAKITDTDFEAVLGASGIADLEVTDDFVNKFNTSYMTKERAMNDKDVIDKIHQKSRSEVLDIVDEKIGVLLNRLPEADAERIKAEKNSFKRLEMFDEAMDNVIKNVKSTKANEDLRKVEEEWANKNKQLAENHKKELESVQKQMKDTNLNFVLKNKIYGYEFSGPFSKLKHSTADIIINQLKSQQHNGVPLVYELDANGNVNVRQETEGGLRDVYLDGNEKLTIDKLLDPLVDPFIKKSDATTTDATQKKTVTAPVDPSKMTLAQMRQAEYAANGH